MSACVQSPPTRWWRWIGHRRLSCPLGHAIPPKAEINDTGFLRCDRWMDGEGSECGRWVFMFAVRGGGAFVAEVTLDEKARMRQLSTPAEMLSYLGIFPD